MISPRKAYVPTPPAPTVQHLPLRLLLLPQAAQGGRGRRLLRLHQPGLPLHEAPQAVRQVRPLAAVSLLLVEQVGGEGHTRGARMRGPLAVAPRTECDCNTLLRHAYTLLSQALGFAYACHPAVM